MATVPSSRGWRSKRRRHSQHFTIRGEDVFDITCNYCGRSYKFKNGEGHRTLAHHLIKNHPHEIKRRPEPATSSQGSTTGNTFRYNNENSNIEIATFICVKSLPLSFVETLHFEVFVNQFHPAIYSHTKAVTETAKLICKMSLPFHFADDCFFEAFVKSFNPEAEKITRREIIHEISRLVSAYKSTIMNNFAELSSKVSICSDVWSDCCERCRYIEITCQWVDDNWILQKRLLAHRMLTFEGPDEATDISHEMNKILRKYGLDTKVFSISFDHDSADAAGLDSLTNICQSSIGANYFYTRCLSNVLNVCVRDMLEMMKDEIEPLRNAIHHLFISSSSRKKWAKFCNENGLAPKYFWPDMPTRWNSAYKMLNRTGQYREALCTFFSQEQYDDVAITADQWDACSKLCQLLGTLKDAIQKLSTVYQPTSVLVVHQFVKIAVAFNSLIGGGDRVGECTARIMAKWLEYYHEIPNIFLIAQLLDPMIREDGLEKLLGFYYDALYPVKDDRTPIPSAVVANAKACLFDLFNEYRIKYSNNSGADSLDDQIQSSLTLSNRVQNFYNERSGRYAKRYDSSNPGKELEAYLNAQFEFVETEQLDILDWWSRWRLNFPVVSLIARDVLAVPASIASFKQAFGQDGYILTEQESLLSPETCEKKRLLADWANEELLQQEMDTDDDADSEVDQTGFDTDSDSFGDF